MAVTIYHNPACGTSRNTLAMIRQSGIEPRIVEYLQAPPMRLARLEQCIAGELAERLAPLPRQEELADAQVRLGEERQRHFPAQPPGLVRQIAHLLAVPPVPCEKALPVVRFELKGRVRHLG